MSGATPLPLGAGVATRAAIVEALAEILLAAIEQEDREQAGAASDTAEPAR